LINLKPANLARWQEIRKMQNPITHEHALTQNEIVITFHCALHD
jgi:hypothetical protein